jgi:hypothetical protein
MFCSPTLAQQKNSKTNMSKSVKIQSLGIPLESFKKTNGPN